MSRFNTVILLACTAAVAGAAGFALAREEGPARPPSGISSTEIAKVDLGKFYPEMNGKWLKMSRADVAPGGGSMPHSHWEQKRAEVVYMIKGALVETQGGTKKTLHAGEGMQSNDNPNERHQIQNRSNEEASVLVIEITSEQPQ